jgi:hypothetical protein
VQRCAWVRSCVLASLLTGCFGVAHVSVQLPNLTVQGTVYDANGAPAANRNITIAVANFYSNPETFQAVESGSLDPDSYHYQFCSRRTGSNGSFVCQFEGESRHIGYMPPLMCSPSESLLRSLVIAVRLPPAPVFAVSISGRHAEIREPSGADYRLRKPHDLPFQVNAKAVRLETSDLLELEIHGFRPAA